MANCKILLLPLLCVMALLVGLLAPLSAVADTAAPAAQQPTAIEKILERDGYLEGVWYPWFEWYQIGANLAPSNPTMESLLGSAWWKGQEQYHGGIDRYTTELIYNDLINMKAIGFNIIGFGGSMYGEGIVYDSNGDVVGIEEAYLRNVRRFLDICREVGVAVMWNVHFHSEGLSNDYVNGKNAWDIISQMICNPTVTEHFIDRYVRPLCHMLAEYPDVVVMASAMDESDNVVNDSDIGDHFDHRELYGVTEAAMVNFITRVTEALREELPGVELTLAGNTSEFTRYSGVDLDFLGRSLYSDSPSASPIENFVSSFPVIATEFGMGDLMSEEQYSSTHIAKRQNMLEAGYKGWFMWYWQSYVGGGTFDIMLQGMKDFTDFRPMIFDLNHYIQEYRAEYRGETFVMDTPAMFYNNGSGKVVWIGSRQATRMDLLRSTDGGKTWEKLLDNVDQSKYVDENGKGVYMDTTAPKSGYIYKVVVRDDKGNEAESAPTNQPEDASEFFASKDYSGSFGGMVNDNPAVLPDQATEPAKPGVTPLTLSAYGTQINRPIKEDSNLIKNGSFESTEGAQWNTDTFLGSAVSVVTDTTTRFGDKSLYFNSSKENKAAWHVFWLDVVPNTDYTFSAWIKGAFISDDNRYCASIGVVDPDSQQFLLHRSTKISTTTRQLVPTAWDNEWHLRSVTFNSGSKNKIGVALYGHSSQLWVDDIALFRSDEGIKYSNPDISGTIMSKMYMGESGCPDRDNLVGNFRMDDADSDYWQTGDGWKNGFVSIQENQYEYGNSLKYTAGEALGYVYFKWVDLKPNTDYVFSVNMKVLESGGGRFSLATRTVRGPVFFLDLDFDQDMFGEDWFTYKTAFNSGAFNRLALAITDLGGSALLDNIRIFEKSKAIEKQDEYLDNRNGWVEDDYGWVYYENGEMVTNKWVMDSVGWCYLGADGYCVTNKWVADSVGWCYLDGSGRMVTNKWVKDSVGWCYVGDNGYCVTNCWKKDSKGWCYLDDQGRMATNRWIKDSVGWCYVGADGYCVTNCWKKDSKGWCYLDEQGRMAVNRWVRDSKGWCYVGGDGYAVTNCWKKDSVGWCYLDGEGSMTKSKWIQDGGKWYYLDANGYMVTGKQTIDGTTYTFGSNGALK